MPKGSDPWRTLQLYIGVSVTTIWVLSFLLDASSKYTGFHARDVTIPFMIVVGALFTPEAIRYVRGKRNGNDEKDPPDDG